MWICNADPALLQAQITLLQDRLLQTPPLAQPAAMPAQPSPQLLPQPVLSPALQQQQPQPSHLDQAPAALSGVSPAGTAVPPPAPQQPPQQTPQQPLETPSGPRVPLGADLATQIQSAVNAVDATDVLKGEGREYIHAPYASAPTNRVLQQQRQQQQRPAEPSVRELPAASAASALESMMSPPRPAQPPQQQPAASSSAAELPSSGATAGVCQLNVWLVFPSSFFTAFAQCQLMDGMAGPKLVALHCQDTPAQCISLPS